jgi:hypothetical protein
MVADRWRAAEYATQQVAGAATGTALLYEGVRDHMELALFPYALIHRLGSASRHVAQIQLLLVGLGAIPVYLLGRACERAAPGHFSSSP